MDFITKNKILIVSSTSLLLIPSYTWKSLLELWRSLRKQYNQSILFYQRHNCMVTYQSGNGLAGWPPDIQRRLPSCGNIYEELYEPILYFIKTAETSLDIAVMFISVKAVYRELLRARQRGVTVRIISNLHHCGNSKQDILELIKQGICFQFFVFPNSNMDSIMHHKFMVKDYKENTGFICTGSMNFSASSVLSNYEDFVFSSNSYLVEQFKREFDKCWENIIIDNQGLINRTILQDAGVL